jgi:hypothetical protein
LPQDEEWQVYTNPDYGLAFRYPATWTLEVYHRSQSTSYQHTLWLKPNNVARVQLTIGFKRVGEEIGIQRTGVGTCELVTRGSLTFLGAEIDRQVLAAQGQDLAVLYNIYSLFTLAHLLRSPISQMGRD